MSDLISRQAAIDALCDNCDNVQAVCAHYPCRQYMAVEILPSVEPQIILCKDCKYFEYDSVEKVNGIPLIIAHEICNRWSDGVKTSEGGFCFLAERRDNERTV